MRIIQRKIILAICSILFTLLVLELAFRVYLFIFVRDVQSVEQQVAQAAERALPAEAEHGSLRGLVRPSQWSDIVYELKPNLRGKFQGVELNTNSFGIRDREYALSKPANTMRIIGLGDSVMFAWGVAENESYLSLLEARQGEIAANHTLEVLNFAVPGYNTTMEVATLEHRAAQFMPDVVILHVINNDWDVPAFMLETPEPFSLRESFLLDFIRARLKLLKSSSEGALNDNDLPLISAAHGGEADLVRKEYRFMTGRNGYRNALKRLHLLSQKLNFKVFVLMGGMGSEMRKTTESLARKYGFVLVSVKPIVEEYFLVNHPGIDSQERRKLLTVSQLDPHPNALGHKLYAQALDTALGQHVWGEKESAKSQFTERD